jgi:hypothetical protein
MNLVSQITFDTVQARQQERRFILFADGVLSIVKAIDALPEFNRQFESRFGGAPKMAGSKSDVCTIMMVCISRPE